jgi:murein DD-endopeptidase MepM/ murein hydrolase activator NlpD
MRSRYLDAVRRAVLALLCVVAGLTVAGGAGGHARPRRSAAGAPYPWPLKPFDRPHPIRGNFNDPRVEFVGEDLTSNFHFGVDISAPDLAPVYAVAPGIASPHGDYVDVLTGGGRAFGYWHVTPAIEGRGAVARGDLLGYVQRGWGHVHFAENVNGVYLNPLRRDALTPYYDTTSPTVAAVTIVQAGKPVAPTSVSGVVDLTCDAYDLPALPLPPPWQDTRVTPALIRWRILHASGRPATRWKIAVDFRSSLLPNNLYNLVYAPGTKQNRAGRPGRYVFYLKEGWSSARLRNGSYRLLVGAWDTRGNSAFGALPFTIANAKKR